MLKSRRVLRLPSEYRDSGWKCKEDTIVLPYALEERFLDIASLICST
jgi:hypothetical protein